MNNLALNFLTDQQARQLIRQELEQFFSENPPNIKQDESESQIIDLDGLLNARPFIGSRSTIYKKVSLGLIPHSKEGKKLYFDLKEIDKWLMSNRIKTPAEIKKEAELYLNTRHRKRR